MVANLEYCIDLVLEELETLPDIEEESTIKTSTQVSEKANSISSDIQSMCSDFWKILSKTNKYIQNAIYRIRYFPYIRGVQAAKAQPQRSQI